MLTGCGGSSTKPVPPVPPSWVQILQIDDECTLCQMSVYREAGSIPGRTGHADRMYTWLRGYTDASVTWYSPWYGAGFVDFAGGMRWAADNNHQVVTFGWGYAGHFLLGDIKQAVDYAWSQGVTVVVGAGNGSIDLGLVNDPYILVVGSNIRGDSIPPGISDQAHRWMRTSAHGQRAFPAVHAAAALVAELYEELKPSRDAAGSAVIRDAFLARY